MIVLDNVCKSYDAGGTYAVRDVSLIVPTGALLVLLGGSGCGKTTTLKMINRLIEPTSGRIEIDGHRQQRRGTRSPCLKHLYNPLSVSRDVIFSH